MNDPVLVAEAVTRRYPGGDGRPALEGVSLFVPQGLFLAVTGPSGSGKSTLLNLLAGLDLPDEGRVLVEGTDLAALDERGRTLLRRRRIGIVFQFFNLVPTLTVAENIALPLLLQGVREPRADERFEEVVGRFGLGRLLDRRPHTLSGGEMQRVSVARAVVHQPPIVLADEPTGNLSTRDGLAVLDLLRRAVDELGRTVVLVTHNPRDAARADVVRFLKDGRLLDETLEGEVKSESDVADRMALLGL